MLTRSPVMMTMMLMMTMMVMTRIIMITTLMIAWLSTVPAQVMRGRSLDEWCSLRDHLCLQSPHHHHNIYITSTTSILHVLCKLFICSVSSSCDLEIGLTVLSRPESQGACRARQTDRMLEIFLFSKFVGRILSRAMSSRNGDCHIAPFRNIFSLDEKDDNTKTH